MVHGCIPPYGFMRDEDGVTVPCPEEQRVLYLMQSLRVDYKMTHKRIAETLNSCGLSNGAGKPWTGVNVRNLFRRGRLLAIGTPPAIDVQDDGTILIDDRDANKVINQDRVISCQEIELSLEEQAKIWKKRLRDIRRQKRNK